jgi:uncharacterized SAM-dependent methyltransferase
MLIGVDLKKDVSILDAAYNDRAGITAAFNLNLLRRMNDELDADFDLAQFAHRAFYDVEQGRVEMHLVAVSDQTVQLAGRSFSFRAGETIHTENSYKYDPDQFRGLAESAGWAVGATWTDPAHLFAIFLLD